MIKKIIKKRKIIVIVSVFVVILIFATVFASALNPAPTIENKSIDLYSDYYNDDNDEGEWHIKKSADWIAKNKVRLTFNVDTKPALSINQKKIFLSVDASNNMTGDRFLKLKSNIMRFKNQLLNDNSYGNNKYWFITAYSNDNLSTFSLDIENKKTSYYGKRCDNSTSVMPCYDLNLQNLYDVMPDGDIDYNKLYNFIPNSLYSGDNFNLQDIYNFDYYPIIIIGSYSKYPADIDAINEDVIKVSTDSYEILNTYYNVIQYDMGDELLDEINMLPGNHWVANKDNLYDVLMQIVNSSNKYLEFNVTDYIDNEYFTLDSVNDINVSDGSVDVDTENDLQKIIWNLGNDFLMGSSATMTVDIDLNNEYNNSDILLTTNKMEKVDYQGRQEYDFDLDLLYTPQFSFESEDTPVLKNYYTVSFDLNLPSGCSINSINSEKYKPFYKVDLSSKNLECSGYEFKGWSFSNDDDLNVENDNTFIMPSYDVTAIATWSKVEITKSLDGQIYQDMTSKPYLSILSRDLYPNSSLQVIFANSCWETIGNTDSGGTKLIYNGIPNENGSCGLSNKLTHPTYDSIDNIDLNDTYLFATDYEYNGGNKKFYLSTNVESKNPSNNPNSIIGLYTCLNNDANKGCDELYYVYNYNDNNNYDVIPLVGSNSISTIGVSKYNQEDTIANIGYKYDDASYEVKKTDISLFNYDITSKYEYDGNLYYGDSISFSNNVYTLNNINQMSSVNDRLELKGKYTYLTNDNSYQSNELYYITDIDDNYIYYLTIYDGLDKNSAIIEYKYGSSIQSNGNGTYTILNYSTISNDDWIDYSSNLYDKYICPSGTNICSNPYYVINVDESSFSYIPIYRFGNSFQYNSNTGLYTLVDTVDQIQWTTKDDYYDTTIAIKEPKLDENSATKHHYTCFNETGTCTKLAYLPIYRVNTYDYIELENGISIKDYIDNLFDGSNVNHKDSTIKTVVDSWYKHNLLSYSDYIDDLTFCNNRTITSYGMFDKDNYSENYITFDTGACTDTKDIFSTTIANGNGELEYPIGIFEYGVDNIEENYWNGSTLFKAYVKENNDYVEKSMKATDELGVRPVISLKSDVEILTGSGTYQNPYIIKNN